MFEQRRPRFNESQKVFWMIPDGEMLQQPESSSERPLEAETMRILRGCFKTPRGGADVFRFFPYKLKAHTIAII